MAIIYDGYGPQRNIQTAQDKKVAFQRELLARVPQMMQQEQEFQLRKAAAEKQASFAAQGLQQDEERNKIRREQLELSRRGLEWDQAIRAGKVADAESLLTWDAAKSVLDDVMTKDEFKAQVAQSKDQGQALMAATLGAVQSQIGAMSPHSRAIAVRMKGAELGRFIQEDKMAQAVAKEEEVHARSVDRIQSVIESGTGALSEEWLQRIQAEGLQGTELQVELQKELATSGKRIARRKRAENLATRIQKWAAQDENVAESEDDLWDIYAQASLGDALDENDLSKLEVRADIAMHGPAEGMRLAEERKHRKERNAEAAAEIKRSEAMKEQQAALQEQRRQSVEGKWTLDQLGASSAEREQVAGAMADAILANEQAGGAPEQLKAALESVADHFKVRYDDPALIELVSEQLRKKEKEAKKAPKGQAPASAPQQYKDWPAGVDVPTSQRKKEQLDLFSGKS